MSGWGPAGHRRAPRRVAPCTHLVWTAIVVATGCGEPEPVTEIVVGADVVGLDVPGEVESLRFDVVTGPRAADAQRIVVPVSPRQRYAADLPVSWGLWQRDQGDAPFEVVVSAFAHLGQEDREAPVVSQRAQLGFVDGEVRHVCLVLHSACAGVACPDGTTCAFDGDASRCVPICVDADATPALGGTELCAPAAELVSIARSGASCAPLWGVDAGTTALPDAAAPDAAIDAGLDGGLDAGLDGG